MMKAALFKNCMAKSRIKVEEIRALTCRRHFLDHRDLLRAHELDKLHQNSLDPPIAALASKEAGHRASTNQIRIREEGMVAAYLYMVMKAR